MLEGTYTVSKNHTIEYDVEIVNFRAMIAVFTWFQVSYTHIVCRSWPHLNARNGCPNKRTLTT